MIREYDPDRDAPFIYKSWLVNFRSSNDLEQVIDKHIYFENHKKIIEKILGESTCLLAVNPEDDHQIFGYIVYQKIKSLKILHYTYVKSPYRKLGIATMLKKIAFGEAGAAIMTSHHTRMATILRYKWNLIFNPYILLNL